MAVPKTAALPLGYAPTLDDDRARYIISQTKQGKCEKGNIPALPVFPGRLALFSKSRHAFLLIDCGKGRVEQPPFNHNPL